jgi:predicted transcriptional regulator
MPVVSSNGAVGSLGDASPQLWRTTKAPIAAIRAVYFKVEAPLDRPLADVPTKDLWAGQAWSLAQRGRTQGEIATELGITQPSVSKILARVEQRVLGELAASVQDRKLRHAVRLEYLCREAVDAWESSKRTSAVDGSAVAERRATGDRGSWQRREPCSPTYAVCGAWTRRLSSRRQ